MWVLLYYTFEVVDMPVRINRSQTAYINPNPVKQVEKHKHEGGKEIYNGISLLCFSQLFGPCPIKVLLKTVLSPWWIERLVDIG